MVYCRLLGSGHFHGGNWLGRLSGYVANRTVITNFLPNSASPFCKTVEINVNDEMCRKCFYVIESASFANRNIPLKDNF